MSLQLSRPLRPLSQILLPHLSIAIPSSQNPRTFSTSSSSHVIYSNPRPIRTLSLTTLATGQASFWAFASYLSQTAPDPLISSLWTLGGFGLSGAFAGLIFTYLRRSVSELAFVDVGTSPGLSVKTHAIWSGKPLIIPAAELVAGVWKEGERYCTFAREGTGLTLYYIVDVAKGVRDLEGVKAVVGGGETLLVLSHKRNATSVRRKWKEWQEREASR